MTAAAIECDSRLCYCAESEPTVAHLMMLCNIQEWEGGRCETSGAKSVLAMFMRVKYGRISLLLEQGHFFKFQLTFV